MYLLLIVSMMSGDVNIIHGFESRDACTDTIFAIEALQEKNVKKSKLKKYICIKNVDYNKERK